MVKQDTINFFNFAGHTGQILPEDAEYYKKYIIIPYER